MPMCETCLVCGLDLMWIPNDRSEKGQYFHQIKVGASGSYDFISKYKFIHLPVPALQLDMFENRYVPAQGWSGENRVNAVK